VAAGIALWVAVVGVALGAPTLYAYKNGLLFFARVAPQDSARAVLQRDTMAQRLLSDTGPSRPGDSAATPRTGGDTSHGRPVALGTPGHVTLQGVPAGARVTLNGVAFRGGDVPPGVHQLAVVASGFAPFQRQVIVSPGGAMTVRVDLQPVADTKGGPCDQPGPAYNQDHVCWDTRPAPLTPTFVPVPADAPIFPREAIVLFHVSRIGETIEARLFGRSNVDTFNDQVLDIAKTLRWNPALKNGEPVESWVQWPFKPTRQ
jgi:hypothetical protein